ncbi:hypothetical protein D3C87_1625140 [compost metagenome]
MGRLESRNDAFFDPLGRAAVHAADDTAAGDIEIHGKGRNGDRGGADKAERKRAHTIIHRRKSSRNGGSEFSGSRYWSGHSPRQTKAE